MEQFSKPQPTTINKLLDVPDQLRADTGLGYPSFGASITFNQATLPLAVNRELPDGLVLEAGLRMLASRIDHLQDEFSSPGSTRGKLVEHVNGITMLAREYQLPELVKCCHKILFAAEHDHRSSLTRTEIINLTELMIRAYRGFRNHD